MNRYEVNKKTLVMSLIATSFMASPVFAFDSGSTGADGDFNPTVNTTLQLPPSGVFNFGTMNIPSGVTITFTKNATNTPVVMLASGNVTIGGILDLNGGSATHSGTASDGNLGDDGIPGVGGPGGFDGGRGGPPLSGTFVYAPSGLGPGGGQGGSWHNGAEYIGAGGGGFNGGGAGVGGCGVTATTGGHGGNAYGSSLLLPLIGGSGGGGGTGGNVTQPFTGSGGGGGGGAILIASSGTVNVGGTIRANGGNGGLAYTLSGFNLAAGGGGSGGAIRIVATTLIGNGTIQAVGGGGGNSNINGCWHGANGAAGRIRLEAESVTRTAASNPAHTGGLPGPVFVAGLPTLRIIRVAGVDAPAQPSGNADITLPANTPNPVSVEFATTGVPVGNTVKLSVTPSATGQIVSVTSPALSGTTDNATASVDVNLPSGPNVLQATVSYTVVASVGDLLGMQFAKGERVEKIELAAGMNGASTTTLVTVSGKRYTVSSLIAAIGKTS